MGMSQEGAYHHTHHFFGATVEQRETTSSQHTLFYSVWYLISMEEMVISAHLEEWHL